MKNNIIISFDKIIPDKQTDDIMLKAILERNSVESKKTETSKRLYLYRNAAAACICILLIFGIFLIGSMDNKSAANKTFTIIANAAEITDSTRVFIGEFQITSDSFGSIGHSITHDNDDTIYKSLEGFYFSECIEFPIRCEGDKINNITFNLRKGKTLPLNYDNETFSQANNDLIMYFILNPTFERKTMNDGIPNHLGGFYISDSTAATQYQVSYQDQPLFEEFGAVSVASNHKNNVLSDRNKIAPVMLFFSKFTCFSEEERKELEGVDEDLYYEFLEKKKKELFDEYHNEMLIDITVQFTDGTYETQLMYIETETMYNDEKFPSVRLYGNLAYDN